MLKKVLEVKRIQIIDSFEAHLPKQVKPLNTRKGCNPQKLSEYETDSNNMMD